MKDGVDMILQVRGYKWVALEINGFLCEGVKGGNALPHEGECNFSCLGMGGVEDELRKFVACTNDAELVVQ